jgi:class 3 adenylate cyclase
VLFGQLARSTRLIWFDARGTGMSERDVTDVSAATLLMDAEAVIDAAQIDRFAVFCYGNLLSLLTALQLATEHPDRVTHLVLSLPYQSMRDVTDTPYAKAGMALAEADWPSYVAARYLILLGIDIAARPFVSQMATAAAAWADPAVGLLHRRLEEATDVGDLLPRVRQPTLVLREESQSFPPVRASQRVAAKIPGAQFRQYSYARGERVADLVLSFLGLSTPTTSVAAGPSGMAVVLFADIVDSTALTERLGDAAFRAKARDLDVALRSIISDAGGTTIDAKTLGDGVLATFPAASQAITAAVAFERAASAAQLQLHVGIHAGDVIHEQNNVFGGAVNIAARISALAAPGQVLVSRTVRDLARTSADVTFVDHGKHALKGIDDAVRVYEVRWRE